jgi:hypothetical protein
MFIQKKKLSKRISKKEDFFKSNSNLNYKSSKTLVPNVYSNNWIATHVNLFIKSSCKLGIQVFEIETTQLVLYEFKSYIQIKTRL